GVGSRAALGGEAVEGGDVDDRPSARHVRHHRLNAEERAEEVDVEHTPEIALGHLVHGGGRVDAGVVDQHVDAPVAVEGRGDDVVPAVGRRHVEPDDALAFQHVAGDDV